MVWSYLWHASDLGHDLVLVPHIEPMHHQAMLRHHTEGLAAQSIKHNTTQHRGHKGHEA
jgi:hypothetical protein